MPKIYIVCVEDEPEVLDAVVKDLEIFEKVFPIETARSAEEARKIVNQILKKNDKIGMFICDHIMPMENGVELLVEFHKNAKLKNSRKVLLTGQAGLEATVKAVNQAKLDYYISKPWNKEDIISVVRRYLTDYIIDTERNYLPFMGILESARLTEAIREKGKIID